MTDFDVHPEGYAPAVDNAYVPESTRDPRLRRDAQQDLHIAIDLAYALAIQLKELHPMAEKQVKGMIFQGNLL
jgi:hypothetical protein